MGRALKKEETADGGEDASQQDGGYACLQAARACRTAGLSLAGQITDLEPASRVQAFPSFDADSIGPFYVHAIHGGKAVDDFILCA